MTICQVPNCCYDLSMDITFVEEAVLRTIVYSSVFDFPLKVEEIGQWLIASKVIGENEILQALLGLKSKEIIEESEGLYFLKDQNKGLQRKERNTFSLEKLIKAKKWSFVFHLLPTVKYIGISGGVAALNAEREADIDLFVITSKKRIWLSRLLLLAFFQLFGRRIDILNKKTRDRFCLNLFIEEDDLEFKDHNVYIANEIVRLKTMVQKDNIYQKLIKANLWFKNYLPNYRLPKDSLEEEESPEYHKLTLRSDQDFLGIWLEGFAKKNQIAKVKANFERQNKEVDEKEVLKIQPNDCQQWILGEYTKRCQSLGVNP